MEIPSVDYCPKFLSNIESWHGHVFFARDLIQNIKPSVIVELGVHKGDSLFSMAEACAESNLKTKLYGIDHWQGDSQSGYYDNDVYDYVVGVQDNYFKQVELVRSTFNDALKLFTDSSIDILHIDGFHTYEATKNDFEKWFPKVKNNGVILLHDIASKNENFGVCKFWNEIKEHFKSFQFEHSQGLGVILKNNFIFNKLFIKRILNKEYQHSFNIYYSLLSTLLRLKRMALCSNHPFEKQMYQIEIKFCKKAAIQQFKSINTYPLLMWFLKYVR